MGNPVRQGTHVGCTGTGTGRKQSEIGRNDDARNRVISVFPQSYVLAPCVPSRCQPVNIGSLFPSSMRSWSEEGGPVNYTREHPTNAPNKSNKMPCRYVTLT